MALGFNRNRDTLDIFNDRWKANHNTKQVSDYKEAMNRINNKMFGSYTNFNNKKETKELYESTGGEYSGIGAVMSQNTETGVITLVQIYKDSPAEKAGLK